MINNKKTMKDVNVLVEIIYRNYLRDLRNGKISLEPIKSYGKILKKKVLKNNGYTLFNYTK